MRLLLPTEPPLVPTPDDARSQLQRELLDPAYHQQNLLDRFLDWLGQRVDRLLDATSRAPQVSTLVAMVVLVVLVVALGLLLSRVRTHAQGDGAARAVLTGETVSARDLRGRAEASLAAGRFEEAAVDGFRALTVRQIERGRLPDTPGATAHEVSLSLAGEHPVHAGELDAVATLFDRVLYGEHHTDRDGATRVLALDDTLAAHRAGVRR